MSTAKPNIDRIFHALGDPTRRAIVEKLSQRPMSVSQLAGPLDITLAAVVQHLQVLEECGLIRTQKVGRVRTCSVAPDCIAAANQWFLDRRSTWENQLDRLGDFLSDLNLSDPAPAASAKKRRPKNR
jgi:DNA-binding transcriptional ArsR family regulator